MGAPQVYVAEAGYMLSRAGVPKHAIITQLAGAAPYSPLAQAHRPSLFELLPAKVSSRKQAQAPCHVALHDICSAWIWRDALVAHRCKLTEPDLLRPQGDHLHTAAEGCGSDGRRGSTAQAPRRRTWPHLRRCCSGWRTARACRCATLSSRTATAAAQGC